MSLIEQLQTALRDPNALDPRTLQASVQEYNQQCRDANLRMRQCLELVRCKNIDEALRLAKASPDLLDTVARLDFPERDALAEIASAFGMSLEPLQTNLSQDLFDLYNESEYDQARGRIGDTAISNQKSDTMRTRQQNQLNQRTVDPDHPWLGLTPYTEDTKEYFFGRDEEVRDLYLRVREQPLTILYGQSGLGKTSLLGAGLIPKLRVEGYQPILLRLGFESGDLPITEQVFYTLSYLQNRQSDSIANFRRQRTLWELFHELAGGVARNLKTPPVLIFDQFEEIFTLGNTKERQDEAAELFRQLADLIENRPPQAVQDRMRSERRSVREYDLGTSPVRVVITLREDFLSHLEAYKKLMPSLMRNRMAVSMLNGPQALEAAVRPGRVQGRNLVSDEVGARIVRFVANRPPETPLEEIGAVPPLLSLLCDELNQLRIEQQQPMIASGENAFAGLESLGRNILDGFYTRSFAGLHPAVRDYIEDRMVTIGGHRNPIAFEDAIADLRAADVSDPETALNQLIQGRLLSIEDRNGVQRLEITHDVLTPLVVRSRDERRERQRAEKAEQEREAANQRELAIRRDRRRLQIVAFVMSLLALFAFFGTCWAVLATHEARHQTKKARNQEAMAKNAEQQASSIAVKLLERQVDLETEQSKSKRLLQNAAQSDRVTARNLTELGRHSDALAYMAQSLDYVSEPPLHFGPVIVDSAISRQAATLAHHDARVNGAVYSPDGTNIVTFSDDNTVKIWHAESRAHIATLSREVGSVRSASYSPDGMRIVTSSPGDNSARILDAKSGTVMIRLDGHLADVTSAAFSPDGSSVVTASMDNTARIWDSTDGTEVATLYGLGRDSFLAAVYSPDGKQVLAASWDKTAMLWDTKSKEIVHTFTGHEQGVVDAVFSPDGTRIITASEDGTAKIWDAPSGALIGTLTGHVEEVRSVRFSPDGVQIVTASDDRTVKIWDASSGMLIVTLNGHTARVASAEFSPDGRWIVTASDDGTARIWDAACGTSSVTLSANVANLHSALFSPDNMRVIGAFGDKTANIWDAQSGTVTGILSDPEGQDIDFAAFSRDGTRIVTASLNSKARIWNATTLDVIATLTGHEEGIICAAFNADGTQVVTASLDRTAKIWDVTSGRDIATLAGHEGGVVCAAFSPDGERIVTASRDRTAKIWAAHDGAVIATLAGHNGGLSSIAISPNGTRIVTSSSDNAAKIWDSTSGAVLATLIGHVGPVLCVGFNSDGTRIVTSSSDNTAKIWDSTSGTLSATLAGHEGPIESVTFNAAGTRVVTASADGTAKVWDLVTVRGPAPSWFADFLRFAARRRLDSFGEMRPWPAIEEESRIHELLQTAIENDRSHHGDIARWIMTQGEKRPAFPGSKVTVGELADQLTRLEASKADLDRAYGWNPAHPLIQIALAKFEDNETRANFLREYGVSRLLKRQPSDKETAAEIAALCRRAEAFLTDQGDQPRTALVRKRAEELEAVGK